jgi:hypothetical protein
MNLPAPIEYVGELVRVVHHDGIDDALVVTLPSNGPDIAPLTFEISPDEARELIAGLAALL